FIAAGQNKRFSALGGLSFEISFESETTQIILRAMLRSFASPRGIAALAVATFCAVIIFAYRPVWHGGFIWDDDRYVTQNRLLTAPDGLRRIWFSLDAPSQYFRSEEHTSELQSR